MVIVPMGSQQKHVSDTVTTVYSEYMSTVYSD